jgi:ribosomal protein L37E
MKKETTVNCPKCDSKAFNRSLRQEVDVVEFWREGRVVDHEVQSFGHVHKVYSVRCVMCGYLLPNPETFQGDD